MTMFVDPPWVPDWFITTPETLPESWLSTFMSCVVFRSEDEICWTEVPSWLLSFVRPSAVTTTPVS